MDYIGKKRNDDFFESLLTGICSIFLLLLKTKVLTFGYNKFLTQFGLPNINYYTTLGIILLISLLNLKFFERDVNDFNISEIIIKTIAATIVMSIIYLVMALI